MPGKTGASHVIAALAVLLLGPFLKRFIEIMVTDKDIETAIYAAAQVIGDHPAFPLESDMTVSILYFLVVVILAFVWGYAYHLKRISGR